MKSLKIFLFSFCCFAFAGFFSAAVAQDSSAATNSSSVKIQWMSIEEALEKCKTSPKKLLIDCYTDWCGWCKKMDAATFSNSSIAEVVNQYYYAVKFNAEQKTDIVYEGKTYKYIASPNGRGYNELAAYLLQGQMSYPSIVYMDDAQKLIQAVPGYQEPAQIDPILKYFGGNYYKTGSWDSFISTYKSPYGGQ